jgi:hypothetical protein
MRPLAFPLLLAGLLGLLSVAAGDARANGQTTHVWITEQALLHLEEGALATLLRSPTMRDPLLNGAMFPDGGYAVNDGYGEIAHWEPFQQAYLQWIRETFSPPWDQGEAAGHLAFLMGLGSHGMADEVFDSLFMERSRIYDPGWDGGTSNLDTASDVLFAAEVGGIVPPALWLPIEVVTPLFNEQLGYPVEAATIESGHNLLFAALAFTEWGRTDEERLSTFRSEFPWTADNLSNLDVPGSPFREARVVARYWEDLWRRLHEPEVWSSPVLEVVPVPGSYAHPTDSSQVEARLHLSFSRGVEGGSLTAISVHDAAGNTLPVEVEHHYGNFSHAVHVLPTQDWPLNETVELRIAAGLMNFDGVDSVEDWSASFSTGPDPTTSPSDCGCSGSGHRPSLPPTPLLLTLLGWLAVRRSGPSRARAGERRRSLSAPRFFAGARTLEA